jgi:CRISPR-associated protein Cmr1
MAEAREWQFKALTAVWTGRVTRIEERHRNGRTELREAIDNDRLITTGLLGSIRWWFEVLVRGLGGSACDPSDTKCEGKVHCVVCELFGCTGWARKFRFQVLAGAQENTLQKDSIKKDAEFRLCFQPLRTIKEEEWALLDLTRRLIAEYGAIGGKTILKPSDEQTRLREPHHQDFGLIELVSSTCAQAQAIEPLRAYVQSAKWRQVAMAEAGWASLQNFWFVDKRYLTRTSATNSSFNSVVGRDERKTCIDCGDVHPPRKKCPQTKKHPRRYSDRAPNDESGRWLAGDRRESKKVFSFKNPPRTFGFVKPGTVEFADIENRLKQAWPDLDDHEFLTGEDILDRLTNQVSVS